MKPTLAPIPVAPPAPPVAIAAASGGRPVWFTESTGMTHALDCTVVARDLERAERWAEHRRTPLGAVLRDARYVRRCRACGGGWH